MSRTRRGPRPGESGASENNIQLTGGTQHDPSGLWQIWSVAYPPAGRRHRWLLIVQACPFGCRGAHAHYGGPDGGIRRAGCGRGSYYLRTRPALGAAA